MTYFPKKPFFKSIYELIEASDPDLDWQVIHLASSRPPEHVIADLSARHIGLAWSADDGFAICVPAELPINIKDDFNRGFASQTPGALAPYVEAERSRAENYETLVELVRAEQDPIEYRTLWYWDGGGIAPFSEAIMYRQFSRVGTTNRFICKDEQRRDISAAFSHNAAEINLTNYHPKRSEPDFSSYRLRSLTREA